ncbi:MAG TPA: Uma2 family endonuclease [Polyangiaceae bacterium]|nr:Uma2 family endonuclease [Polyangiaceae bacterium]
MSGANAVSNLAPLLSLEQWAALAEDEPGELVDGRLVDEEMPNVIHELIVGWLLAALRAWAVPRGGLVLGSETKLAVAPGRGRKPDVAVYLPGSRKPPGRASLVYEPPSLVVEIVSTRARDGRRDRIEKVGEYARFGVLYYWLVDPQLLTLEVLVRSAEGAYVHALGATEGVVSAVPGCEGLALDLDGLWAEVAALDDENEGGAAPPR